MPTPQPRSPHEQLSNHLKFLKAEWIGSTAGLGLVTGLAFLCFYQAADNPAGPTADPAFYYGLGCWITAAVMVVCVGATHGHYSTTLSQLAVADAIADQNQTARQNNTLTLEVVAEVRRLRETFEGHDRRVGARVTRLVDLGEKQGRVLHKLALCAGDELGPRRDGEHGHT